MKIFIRNKQIGCLRGTMLYRIKTTKNIMLEIWNLECCVHGET